MSDMSFLKLDNVSKSFGTGVHRAEVLNGITLDVAEGDQFCSGAGCDDHSIACDVAAGIDAQYDLFSTHCLNSVIFRGA